MRLRDGITMGLGGAALATSVIGVGGALRETQAIVAVLVGAALLTSVLARRSLDRASPLIVFLGIAATLTALQLVPLPSSVVSALDGTGNALRTDGAGIARTSPWMSISLDPAGSTRALVYLLTLIGVAVLSLRFAAAERGRFVLLGAVAVTCGIAAVIAGVHMLVSATSLYGLYTPAHINYVAGPLLNPNHMGGLMAIGAILSVGLAFYPHQPTQLRVVWVIIAVGCVLVCGATLSRGAIVGLVIGTLVAVGVFVAGHLSEHRRRRRRSLQRDLPIAIVVGLGLAIALFLSAGNVVDQLGDTSLNELNKPISKYEAWRSSLQLVKESPWVGIGRGAVETNLTRVHPASGQYTFSHLENEYLSAVVEWGIPGALLLGLAFAWCIKTAVRRWRDGPLAAAALGALSMILFQSCVDFGVELLGLGLPVTIIAATVLLAPLRETASPARARFARVALLAALIAGAMVVLLPGTTTVQEDHDAILAIEPASMEAIRDTIERHPLDYFGFGQAADVSSRANDIHAVDFLSHALALHPTHPGLHRLAARMLVGLKRYDQAAIEYSLALNSEPAPHLMLTEILMLIPGADDIAASIPVDYPNVDLVLHSLKELNRIDISEKWLLRVAQRPQHDLRIIDTLYDLQMTNREFETAEATAKLRLSLARTTTSKLMLAKTQLAREEYAPLLEELADVKQWAGRTDEKGAAWLILCDVHIAKKEWDTATECLHRLDASGLLVSRLDISKRLDELEQQRMYEAKMQAAQAIEKSLEARPTKP